MVKAFIKSLPPVIKGLLGALVLVFNTIFFAIIMYGPILVKIIMPVKSIQKRCTTVLEYLSECWINVNIAAFTMLHETQWEITNPHVLSKQHWYFLISNHQSFTDIFVLQKILGGVTPPFKFFIKQSLIWMPLIGPVWWALDCIFMKRYPKTVLDKKPYLRAIDMKRTQAKCHQFKHKPVTIVNFIEGTRFTLEKQKQQKAQGSHYEYLLMPKAGGLAYIIEAMEGRIHELIDVTIAYDDESYNFWDFLCGKLKKITVQVDLRPIPAIILKGDYFNDAQYRAHFKQWLSSLWDEKEQLLKK